MRLDQTIVERFQLTRQKAQSLLVAELVSVNGKITTKKSQKTTEADVIELLGDDCPYVSRSALKLIKALDYFAIEVEGKTAADFGSSTGGFTEVLLERGIKEVRAFDVGNGQMNPKVSEDARVIQYEGVNCRAIPEDLLDPKVDLVVMDVSFISQTKVLPMAKAILKPEGQVVSLVKPQFELQPEDIDARGIVKNASRYDVVHQKIREAAKELGFTVSDFIYSPIKGGDGNREFLVVLK